MSYRFNISIVVIFNVLLVFSGCKKDSPAPNGEENSAGTYYQSITTSDGQNRQYIVYVPESAAGLEKVPVLFMIHGTNQSGQVHYDKDLWNPKADQEGFIVVYPTALVYTYLDNGTERTTTKWAAGDLGETDVSKGALPLADGQVLQDDLLFFDEMIEDIKNDFVVDDKRFYITGFSNGAQMTARLAAQRSNVFAAVTIHAGNLSEFIPTDISDRPMSMILTVGANDDLFLELIGESDPIPLDTSLIEIQGINDVVQRFLSIDGLDNDFTYSVGQYGSKETAEFLYASSNQGLDNQMKFVVIEELGHNYTEILVDPFWSFLKEEYIP